MRTWTKPAVIFTALLLAGLPEAPASIASAPCGASATGEIEVAEIPEGTDVVECDLVGRSLDLGAIVLDIPDAGESVVLTADRIGERGLVAEIRTGLSGEVTYQVDEVDEVASQADGRDPERSTVATSPADARLATNGCDDDYMGATKYRYLRSAWRFYIGDGGLPAAGTAAQLAAAIEAAGKTWSTENSPCFAADGSRAPDLNYAGRTTTEADVTESDGEINCINRDHTSTIDAGNLGTSTVAANCTWTNDDGDVTESDIRFNTTDHDFTYSPGSSSCSGDYDVLSVLTHETGHTYGLKDKEALSSAYQTMFHASIRCSAIARDLGRSDVRHLRSHYPPLG